MQQNLRRWVWRVMLILAYGSLLQAGCLRNVQNELDLLWAPAANLNYVYESALVNWFGPGVLKFW
jgi:hypothetical protein